MHLSQQAHRITIGVLGLLLPVLVYLVAGVRKTDGLPPWQPLASVSEYYYTGAVAVFVGVLFAMALFLITYPGYEGFVWDRVVGRIAGAAGFGVALFPTGPPHGIHAPSWWYHSMSRIHYSCALVLFTGFVLFSVWLFRRSDVPDKRARPKDKRRRDAICLACGVGIVVCLAWAVSAMRAGRSVLLPESLAIMAFSISWLAKGEAHQVAVEAMRGLKRAAWSSNRRGKPRERI